MQYTLKSSLWEVEGSTLWLNTAEDPRDPDLLSPRMLKFILAHAKCAHCAGAMAQLEAHAACRTRRGKHRWAEVEAYISHSNGMREILRDELMVFNRGKLTLLRRRKLASAGESSSAAQLRALLALQENRCFYCYTQLFDFGRRANTHLDHFLAVAEGGSNGIKNMRYACRTCNEDKGVGDGTQFQRKMLRRAPPEVVEPLRLMQAAVEAWDFEPASS